MNLIPAMTHALGRHWRQPKDIRDAPMDGLTVLLTPQQLAELPEYSASIPTGAYPGKCWKRIEERRTLLCWFSENENPALVSINFRDIEVVT